MPESLIDKANKASASAFQNIPIIDISNIRSSDAAAKRALADQVRDACISAGFFYVKNHGIPEETIQGMLAVGRQFFSLPVETKMKLEYHKELYFKGYFPMSDQIKDRTDSHELYSVGWEPGHGSTMIETDDENGLNVDKNVWPEEDVPEFREKVMKYYHKAFELGKLMFPLFALALNESEDLFVIKKSAPVMNILHYPPGKASTLKPHTDWGCYTILYQEYGKQALQILNTNNEWIDAPAIPGTLVVNIGDQLSRWTNDLFKSTTHQAVNVSGQDRFSVPIFIGTDCDVKMEPIASCVSPERPWRYEVPAITAGEYVKSKLESDYA